MTSDVPDLRDNQIAAKAAALNGLWDIVSSTVGSMLDETTRYVRKTTFSEALSGLMQGMTTCVLPSYNFCAGYHLEDKLGGYYFGRYGLYEFPFAWWHKCMMLSSRTFTGLSNELSSIECSAWDSRKSLESVDYRVDALWELTMLDGGITQTMMDTRAEFFETEVNALITQYASSQEAAVLQPMCLSRTVYNKFATLSATDRETCMLQILQWTFSNRATSSTFGEIEDVCWEIDASSEKTTSRYNHNTLRDVKNWMRLPTNMKSALQAHNFCFDQDASRYSQGFLGFNFIPPSFDRLAGSFIAPPEGPRASTWTSDYPGTPLTLCYVH